MTQVNRERVWDGKEEKKGVNLGDKSNNLGKLFDRKIDSSDWLTTKEAAEYLRTSPNQIRNWVYQGKVQAYKLFGKSLRFKLRELDLLHKGGQAWE